MSRLKEKNQESGRERAKRDGLEKEEMESTPAQHPTQLGRETNPWMSRPTRIWSKKAEKREKTGGESTRPERREIRRGGSGTK